MNTAWEIKEENDITFWHCGRPAYWKNDEVFCSKCQEQHIELESHQDGVWEVAFCYEEFVIRTVAYGRTKQEAQDQAESKIPDINEELLEIEINLEGVIE